MEQDKSGSFKLQLEDNWLEKDSVIEISHSSGKLVVLSKPKKLWYKLLLQYFTFNYYKAPWEYIVRPFINNKI